MKERESTTQDLCLFLADYCSWIIGSGASCIRLEKNVQRMAKRFGKNVEITITPRHVHIFLMGSDRSDTFTAIASVQATTTSFNIVTRLSQLSWEVADKGLSLETLRRKFEEIVTTDHQNKWLVLVLVTLANASFCRLFGGDVAAMLIVGIATMQGYYVKMWLLAHKIDLRVVMFICAFVSSVIAASDHLFSLSMTPQVTIGTSALYLVPGIPYLNSFSDMLNRYYICSFSRFMDAFVLTACLSLGLCLGMLMMKVGMF